MNPSDVLSYVKASAALLALQLDDARAQRVAEHLMRTAALAQLLEDAPLSADDELAEIYSPMAFVPAKQGDL